MTDAAPLAPFDRSFREALIDVVDGCLKHRPEAVPVEQYFQDHLEPVLSALAIDCIASQPENPTAFLHAWVRQRECETSPSQKGSALQDGDFDVSPIARMAISSWHHKECSRELAALQKEQGTLRDVLKTSQRGLRLLRAAEAGDRSAVLAILEPLGLAQGQSSSAAAAVRAMDHLGKVLRCLRSRGVTSASSAFLHFSPDQDWTVSTQRMQVEISHLQVLQEDEIHQLVQYLDHEGSGRVSYQSFRTMVVRFLATSRDFHYALSPEEFNAIMFRIESRLASNGTSIGQALAELDSSNSGALSDTEFMQSLRLLRLGLSNKEVAQVFNSLSASSFKAAGTSELPNPLMRGQVSIDLFASLVAKSSKDSRLKEWATSTFNKIREVPPPSLQHSATSCSSSWLRFLRHYADPPVRQFLNFGAFSTLLTAVDSSMTSPDISRLWCVLEKDDQADEPLVRIEELLRWMGGLA